MREETCVTILKIKSLGVLLTRHVTKWGMFIFRKTENLHHLIVLDRNMHSNCIMLVTETCYNLRNQVFWGVTITRTCHYTKGVSAHNYIVFFKSDFIEAFTSLCILDSWAATVCTWSFRLLVGNSHWQRRRPVLSSTPVRNYK